MGLKDIRYQCGTNSKLTNKNVGRLFRNGLKVDRTGLLQRLQNESGYFRNYKY